MSFPKSCVECKRTKTCRNAYYGSALCKYKDEIKEAARKSKKERRGAE